MSRSKIALVASALSFGALGACNAAPPSADDSGSHARNQGDVGVSHAPLLGAPVDPGHTFDVGVCAKGTKADGTCAGGRCSGTLVGRNVVLTARHCVHDIAYADDWCASTFTGPLSSATTLVTTSDSVRIGTPKWYEVATTLVPPNNALCSDDLAVLILATPVPAYEASPVRVDASRDYAKHPPSSVAIVGRGAVAENMDGTVFDTGNGLRRILENVPFVCGTDDPSAPCNLVDYSSPPTNMFASPPSYLVIGPALGSGDSGSGVFDQRNFDHTLFPAIIGVSAAVTWGADGFTDFGLVSRLDTHKAFLRDSLRQAGCEDLLDE